MGRCFVSAVVVLLGLAAVAPAAAPQHIPIDEAKLSAAGIRKLPPARRLVLYTDLPSSPEIDSLPKLFDQAFPQWCRYFFVPESEHADWQMTGFLIKNKERFRQAGLMPEELPPFRHGFSIGYDLWLYDQPSDYYRRHLLLHEGTHGFMQTLLGRTGPPWYAEGTAEMMGTHRLDNGRLTLNIMPATREEVPDWGRIRRIKDSVAERRAMPLSAILNYSSTAHLETEPYAWCWAACAFLDRHPRYQERFRQLSKGVLQPNFTDRFRQQFAADWRDLNDEWAVFISGIEYGYDVARTAIDFRPGRPCPAEGETVEIAADRGWQNSGIHLEEGNAYQLTASGRYQVGSTPQPWWCEPGGVSLRYYQGRPLGVLLAVVRPDVPPDGAGKAKSSPFLRPVVVGLGLTLPVELSGTLFLKINHSAAELQGNSGRLKVQVKPE